MNSKIDVLYRKLKTVVRKFVLRSQVYDDPPMRLHFAQFRAPKRVYDIRKKYLTFSIKSKDDIYKYLFYLFILLLLFLLPYASQDTGISNQEWVQVQYSESLHNGVTPDVDYVKTHGMFLHNATYAVSQWLCHDNPFAVRHAASSLFGWGAILMAGMFLLRLFSWRAAFFGILFLFISPRFTGHAYSDLPNTAFAFSYIFSLYHIYRFYSELPNIRRSRLILIILGIALACNIHFGGTVLLLYLILILPIFYFLNNPIRKILTKEYLKNWALTFCIGICITLAVYLLCWPCYGGTTFSNASLFHGLAQMTVGDVPVRQLFDGELIWSQQPPQGYLYKYLFITTPLVVILCSLIFLIICKTTIKKMKATNALFLLTAFFFPVIYYTRRQLNTYEDISQYLFLYPVLIILATSAYESLMKKIDDRYTNVIIVGVGLFLSILPIRTLLFNHPFTVVYFNEISGGVRNAYGKYELDPSCQTNKKACESFIKWMRSNDLRELKDNRKIVVCTNGNEACRQFFKQDTAYIDLHFCDFEKRHEQPWDYFILFPYQQTSYQLKSGLWMAEETPARSISMERIKMVVYFKNEND